MCLTTIKQSYHEFRTYDNALDFDNEFADLDFLEGSSFAIDDGRTFSTSSDISEISYGNLLSDTLYTTGVFGSNDGRSFSNISNFSANTFEKLIFDTSVTTATDEPEDHMITSSDSISKDHVSSMIAFLASSRHTASIDCSFPKKVTDDETSSEELKPSILVRNDEIQKWDVLSGRGGKSNHHIGNKVFRHLVTEMKPAYRSSKTRNEKASLVESLIEKVHRKGGRFLIESKGCLDPQWRLMTKVEARRKTSQALRETRTLQWTY